MLELVRGDSRTLTTTIYTDEDKTTRQDLTNVTAAKFTARKGGEAGEQIFQRTMAGGDVSVTDAANGEMQIVLEASDTSGLPAKPVRLAYDLELTWSDGQVTTVELGTLLVKPDVSY